VLVVVFFTSTNRQSDGTKIMSEFVKASQRAVEAEQKRERSRQRLLWIVSLEKLVELGCQQARRNLTSEEWDRYLSGQDYRETREQWP
jgi:hypothetical protein